jgi:hypothetical protein
MLQNKLDIKDIICWFLGFVFLAISILNLMLVHLVPAVFYFLFSLIYFSVIHTFLLRKLNINIPFKIKILLAFLLFWGTLAVTDLADILGL